MDERHFRLTAAEERDLALAHREPGAAGPHRYNRPGEREAQYVRWAAERGGIAAGHLGQVGPI